jgi:hypothetical protein
VSAGTVTFAGTFNGINIYGSFSVVAATVLSGISSCFFGFYATTTGKTITTNGVSLSPTLSFFGVGGGWTLAGALTTTNSITVNNGTFSTGNFAVSCASFNGSSPSVRTVTLGSSTITVYDTGTALDFTTTTNLTFNRGTSLINVIANSTTIQGGGLTFYDMSFTGTYLSQITINGANAFRNFTFAARSSSIGVNYVLFAGSQTITGTFSVGSGSTNVLYRTFISSSVRGTARTLTCAAVSLAEVDFCDITIAGAAAPASGTRLGNCTGNSGITFPAAKTVYWNLGGTQQVYSTGWATSSGGVPDVNNFPLAQDTAVVNDTGAAGTITFLSSSLGYGWNLGTVDMSARTVSVTISFSTIFTAIYGNWINGSGVAFSGTSAWPLFSGNSLQTLTNAGKTWTTRLVVQTATGGTLRLLDALTTQAQVTVVQGTFDANNFSVSASFVDTSYTTTRTVAVGSGTWVLTLGGGTAWNAATSTGLTITGTGTLSCTSGSAKSFSGGSISYGSVVLNQGGAGALTISGINTFGNITNTYAATGATTITLAANQTVAAFSAGGQATRLLTLNSSVTGTQRTIAYSGAGTITAGDYLSVRDIAFTPAPAINGTTAYVWYLGANSVNTGNNSGGLFVAAGTVTVYQISNTATTTWTVPSGWSSSSNTIHLIGGGGGGGGSRAISSSSKVGGAGGGGGGYRVLTNYSTTVGSVITVAVGTGGTAGASAGGTGGTGGTTSWAGNTATGGTGGSSTATPTSIGGTGGSGTFSGGNGAASVVGASLNLIVAGGGGGGAAGPNGNGGAGGTSFASTTTTNAGGGGGGNGGGTNGTAGAASTGGTGGNNSLGQGGGASGTVGSFGGGGGGRTGGAVLGTLGGQGRDILNTIGGAGGSGGASGSSAVAAQGGGQAANYGAGGSGASTNAATSTTTGGVGGQGLIVIVITLATTYSSTISETATGTDLLSALGVFGVAAVETATGTDTVDALATFLTALDETSTASDAVDVLGTFNPAVDETSTGTDAVSVTGTFLPAIDETSTASDAVSSSATFTPAVVETATITDAPSATGTFKPAVAETATITDAPSAKATFNPAVSETATITDATSAKATFQPAVSETATITDATSALGVFNSVIDETATGTDLVEVIKAVLASVTELVTISDLASGGLVFSAHVDETGQVSDIDSVLYQGTASIFEYATASDSVSGYLPWVIIDDDQTPNWGDINNLQSAGWASVGSVQSPGWNAVSDTQNPGWDDVDDNQTPGWQNINTS